MMGSLGFPELLVVLVLSAMALIIVWPAMRICRRVGLSPWLGILAIVPVANVLFVWFLAFAEWPLEHAARQSR